MSNTLLRVYPSELKIPFEFNKQRSCCMQLTNRSDQYVAFKVKTTNPGKYTVRHICVTMQAPTEMLSDYHCKDKFLVQSVVARDGTTMKKFIPELFTKAPGRVIEEFKMRVVYVAGNPPSPVPEEAEEEDSSPRSEVMNYEVKRSSVFDAAPTYIGESEAEPSCAEGTSAISRLVGERGCAVDEKQKLHQEIEMLRETRSSQQGFSLMFVLLVFMSSVFIGHLINDIKV